MSNSCLAHPLGETPAQTSATVHRVAGIYHVGVFRPLWNCLLVLSCAGSLVAQSFHAPAGMRPAQRRPNGAILPGGRIIQPEGEQILTGNGPFGLALSPEGKSVMTANGGPDRNSLTILEHGKNNHWEVRHLL